MRLTWMVVAPRHSCTTRSWLTTPLITGKVTTIMDGFRCIGMACNWITFTPILTGQIECNHKDYLLPEALKWPILDLLL